MSIGRVQVQKGYQGRDSVLINKLASRSYRSGEDLRLAHSNSGAYGMSDRTCEEKEIRFRLAATHCSRQTHRSYGGGLSASAYVSLFPFTP